MTRDELAGLAKSFKQRHKHSDGWTFHLEHPGLFAYSSKKWPTMVFFTPDWDANDGFVVIQVDDGDGTVLESEKVPYRGPLDADQLMQIVKPYLKKYKLVQSVRNGNPVDGEATPPQPSGMAGLFKLAAGVAVVGLAGAAIWKFFAKDTGTIIVDTKPTKPAEPEQPLVGSKILAKLPAFNPEATGTIPYYVVNVFSSQELARPAPGAIDIATYLRSVPADDIQVFGPYLPAQQQQERFAGPMPTLAVIVAPNGMVITSMNQAELQAITPAQ